MKEREIRAVFDEETITVYQAYRAAIALPAVQHQQFVSPFKMERMTWIKPSFLWMMYRSGWAGKEGQEHVLAIKIRREGWEWALGHAALSHFVSQVHPSYDAWKSALAQAPVRIQWDPEKDIHLDNLDYRSIQVGLSGKAVPRYVQEWTVEIEDMTEACHHIRSLVEKGDLAAAKALLPKESTYPTPEGLKANINHS